MTDRRSSADLGPNLEAALSSFPFPERDWEKDALAVQARLAQAGSTDAVLLGAPLPAEPGEPNAPLSATATPPANSGVRTQSLADIARRSVDNKQAAEREMARESLALASKRPSALEVQALREVMNSKLPAAPPSAAVVSAAPISEPPLSAPGASPASTQNAATVPPVRAQARQAKAAANPWPKLGLAAAGIALAAGVLFWLRQPAPIPLATASAPAPTATQKNTTQAAPAANTAAAAAAEPALVGVNPDTLPESEPKPAEPAHDKAATVSAHAPAPSASATGPKAEKIELEDEPEKPVANAAPAPVEQPVAKVLPPDPALRPADSTGGAVPAKPSSGAVQAALGAVMSGARHCVAGEDGPSSALVVFASDGHVQSVSVGGSAAGTPAGSCIEAQLGRARVQPFAASSFSVSATVRPD